MAFLKIFSKPLLGKYFKFENENFRIIIAFEGKSNINVVFTYNREEENSVVHHMKPEFKCSTKQLFYLTSPLRSASKAKF